MNTVVDDLDMAVNGVLETLRGDVRITEFCVDNVVNYISPGHKYGGPMIRVFVPIGEDRARRFPDNQYIILDPIMTVECSCPYSMDQSTVVAMASLAFELINPGFRRGDKHVTFLNTRVGVAELTKGDEGNRWRLTQKWNVRVT